MEVTEKMGLQHIRYVKDDKIARVILNRPNKLNSYTNLTTTELYNVWEDFKEDDNLRVAILSGEGKSFCAGHDLAGYEPILTEPPSLHYETIKIYKPIVCAYQGYALGGGASLAFACDVLICSEEAKIGYPQSKGGVVSIGGPPKLPRLIPGLAKWYLFSGELIDAQEAYRLGLVLKVVPRDKLMEEADNLAKKLAECSPISISHMKEVVERGKQLPLDATIEMSKDVATRAEHTEDFKDSLVAFKEKRAPKWKER